MRASGDKSAHDSIKGLERYRRPTRTRKYTLLEACEYRANFLNLRPNSTALLNVEADHFDWYRSLEQLQETFLQFAQQTADDGFNHRFTRV